MPPKNKKEEEALRLAEEERKRQLEEQLKKEEDRKYGCIQYQTKMQLPLTQYIINEIYNNEDQLQIIKEYLYKILQRNNQQDGIRDIDIQILSEQILNDIEMCQDLQMKGDQIIIFINMMFLVYINQHHQFGLLIPNGQNKGKTKQNDKKLFDKLLRQHSTDGIENKKVFDAKQLQSIIEYIDKGYLSHWQLLQQAHSHNQRPLEIQVDQQIDLPLPQPLLEDHLYYKPIIIEDVQSIKKTEAEEAIIEYHEPTDEELLDSIIMNAITDKLKQAQEELDEKLQIRQQEIENKLQEMVVIKKKK